MPKIIEFKPKSKEELLLSIKEGRACLHINVIIDKHEKELRCASCDAVIHPFDYVMSLAREERNLVYRFQELNRDIKHLSEQKERLAKDLNNLKSSIRKIK